MLTGHRAFAGDDVSDTLAAVLRAEVDWSLLPKTLSPSLRTFLTRCLKKDPKQRVHDIADMRLALEGAFETVAIGITDPGVAPRSLASAWRRAVPSVVSALAAGGLVGVVAWGAWRWARPRRKSRGSRLRSPKTRTLRTPAARQLRFRRTVHRSCMWPTPPSTSGRWQPPRRESFRGPAFRAAC